MKPEQSKPEGAKQGMARPREEGATQQRRPYEPPHLVAFGHVRELTAGKNPGFSDFSTSGSIA
ncbi:MAG: hypothetical protein DLM67_11325 [Candidatus Nephthysia bennettiae]|uniref:Lasso RiPP family leader peptide-containing protein n=1 Tax=Candidatus Nephthysia bennettiae TaxID=3127016 RepID=A0A934K6Z4_9BACT|nr:lasso RiPP family leader peptide-containing protein [Candidatus Dormibacteraeota bacterium]MBJ7614863.1 lasso RiPP family leader peptide-containing protein [Candidatus Dormibacteraeota bacterium]PZR95271.1 MAG: hypothetical protein DLM67_11325 [Candidatus Dormibacteraeota bacterium]